MRNTESMMKQQLSIRRHKESIRKHEQRTMMNKETVKKHKGLIGIPSKRQRTDEEM